MWPFSRPSHLSVALIDLGDESVGGALACLEEGKRPIICASVRTPIDARSHETATGTAILALRATADELVASGAPQLRSVAGSGKVDTCFVGLRQPWQTHAVREEELQPGGEFTYSHAMEQEALAKAAQDVGTDAAAGDSARTEAYPVATLLNGYLTQSPYGKRAKRAEIVALLAAQDVAMREKASAILRQAFHTSDTTLRPLLPEATRVLQAAYPLQKDFFVLLVSGESTEAMSVKRGHIVDAASVGKGARALDATHAVRQPGYASAADTTAAAEAAWRDEIGTLLRSCATHHALPRTVFLIADSGLYERISGILGHPSLRSLWLSDEPVTIIPLLPRHLSSSVTITGTAEGDVPLSLLAQAAHARYLGSAGYTHTTAA